MSETTPAAIRQSVSLPSGSCDMRVGEGVLDRFGKDLCVQVGRPRKAALVHDAGADADLVEEVRRQLTDAGFLVSKHAVDPGEGVRTVTRAEAAYRWLDGEGLTADDAFVAVGGDELLSLASFVAATWCGGMILAEVPTNMRAAVEASVTPSPLDVGSSAEMVNTPGRPRMLMCDLSRMADDESTRLGARAIMVASSVAEANDAFTRLAGRAAGIVSGDRAVLSEQLADTARSRGRIVSSGSVAVRQSISYGVEFARALGAVLDRPCDPALLRAEGLRFSSRLACVVGDGSTDFVFTQDALLERLKLLVIGCDVDPDDLQAALKSACFKRSNRLLLALPLAVGRVRPTAVDDDVLAEHIGAFCASRRRLLGL